jgi:hypothetical protein
MTNFLAIQRWAVDNKMIINICKTKEIVFRHPNSHLEIHPLCLPGIDLIEEVKLLGVMLANRLNF